jgi:methylmalonyl-CoA mutase
MESKDGLTAITASFEATDTDGWFEKIVADLKGRSLEDTAWQYDEDLSILPFAGRSESGHYGADIGFQPDWEIAEEFYGQNEAEANNRILEALRGGCETLLIHIDEIPDWPVLLRDVRLDMIRTYIMPPAEIQAATVEALNRWVFDTGAPADHILVRSNQIATMGAAHEASRETVVDLLVKTLSAGLDSVETTDSVDSIECVAEIGPHFFIEVARLRALRILWQNILEGLGRKGPNLFLEVRMASKFLSEDMHQNMIAAGSKAIAAICGGADRLVINPSPEHDDALNRRIARNVNHILKYESNLNRIPDPVKGSYYMEGLVEQLVRKAWDKLIAE